MTSRADTAVVSGLFWCFQAAWSLKTRALTEMVYIDEVEVDQEGIADMMLDESSIAQVARESIIYTYTRLLFSFTGTMLECL